jgi:superfamily II DNA or RNA helicase
MSIVLHPFQKSIVGQTYEAWQKRRNVLAVAPTGSGKTVIFSDIVRNYGGACCVMAHRRELVSQISLALCKNGIRHALGAPPAVQRDIIALQIDRFGHHFHHPESQCRVIGVDMLLDANSRDDPWFGRVGLWVMDEAHHLLRDNKWGRAISHFPNAYGFGVTATPQRADGKGLGRHACGVMDHMIVGPTMSQLIAEGYLSRYRVFCPPSDIQLQNVPIGASGEYSDKPLRAAVRASKKIVGDVVRCYLKYAAGKLGVTFAVDIEEAQKYAQAFNDRGVPAEVVTYQTPTVLRSAILRRFERREILQLVNVDMFGEGFDLPAIEVVSMARPTKSLALYLQQFGRAVRILEGKEFAIIIDHVGNVREHKLPNIPRVWTLDNQSRGVRSGATDAIPLTVCRECIQPYERVLKVCPYCGFYPEPAGRSTPKEVDGDLTELSQEFITALLGERDRIDGAPNPGLAHAVGPAAFGAMRKHHWERQEAQRALRERMAQWGGWRMIEGDDLSTAQRRFFHQYGIDVLTAQTLNAADAATLTARIA